MSELRWKCLKEGMRSGYGDCEWMLGKWKCHRGELRLCDSGFHASEYIVDAMRYVPPGYVCRVEVRGKCIHGGDKSAYSQMRVVSAYEWAKEDSVALAIYAAESVLHIFESRYPNDLRPRQAIEAAQRWFANPSEENRKAGNAAARAAKSAAREAARATNASASYAANAAYHATNRATDNVARATDDPDAYAAYYAATRAADNAARATNDEVKSQIQEWIEARISRKEDSPDVSY